MATGFCGLTFFKEYNLTPIPYVFPRAVLLAFPYCVENPFECLLLAVSVGCRPNATTVRPGHGAVPETEMKSGAQLTLALSGLRVVFFDVLARSSRRTHETLRRCFWIGGVVDVFSTLRISASYGRFLSCA